MKQVQQDKYNVAWFTLAQCIARGEKVRALGVYRLLSHSIDNVAFSLQLEGDILLAFDDKEQAKHKYQEAANMYYKSGKMRESAAINEHLHDLDPENIDTLIHLINTYKYLNDAAKTVGHLSSLFHLYMIKNLISQAETILAELDILADSNSVAELHQNMVFALLRDTDHSPEVIYKHMSTAIQGFACNENSHKLQRFLSSLEALNEHYAQDARKILQEP